MNDGVGFKKRGAAGLWTLFAAIALASWGVWAFFNGGDFRASSQAEYAFGGWVYDREAQRTAGAALAAAGLNDYRWEDGKLVVPGNQKGEYQTALATAGAFPKAPSESRREAIREIGAFESEAKTRMRELDACAYQLERTLERLANVEYATVGVRARREQVGLTAKNVVTASIGVACKKGFSLNLDAISAITVAAKHQLGIENNENISIIDLVEGKSYFGTENSVGSATTLAYFSEKERVEKYWRAKFLETFDYIKNARISVAVDLRFAERSEGAFGAPSEAKPPVSEIAEGDSKTKTAKKGTKSAPNRGNNVKFATNVADVGTIARPEPLAVVGGRFENGGAFGRKREGTASSGKIGGEISDVSVSFAKLGNPRPSAIRSVRAENLALSAPSASVATKESAFGGRIKPASFVETPELADLANLTSLTSGAELASGDKTPVAPSEPPKKVGADRASTTKTAGKERGPAFDGEPVFEIRSLVVRIAIPRRYVRLVAQSLASERADLNENSDFAELYRETEAGVLDETKRVALKMLRPIQERNGWSENETGNWVDVSVFSDVETQDGDAKNTFRYELEGDSPEFAVAETENWRVFGNFADVADRVAEEAKGKTPETEEDERADGVWTAALRKVDWDSPFVLAGIAGSVGVLLAFGGVWRAAIRQINRKKKKNKEKRETAKNKPSARNGQNQQKKATVRTDDENGGNAKTAVDTPPTERRRRTESKTKENVRTAFDFDDFCRELDADCDDDLEITAFSGRKAEARGDENEFDGAANGERQNDGNADLTRRREALDFVSRNPDRAASALRNWIKPGA